MIEGMTRRLAAIMLCGVVAAGISACHGNGHSTQSPGANTRTAVERPQAATLKLPAGRSSAQYRITAPKPAQYSFDVTVSAPASADVAVNILTWYGAQLSILDSTHDSGMCTLRGSQETCLGRFPFLPAQRAGTWTVVASKRSEPPATVHLAVTFAKP